MNPFTVNWTDVWTMTGIGIGIVFVVLLLLVFVLQLMGYLSKDGNDSKPAKACKAETKQVPCAATQADDNDKAAIATALYLYFQEVHDTESYVFTIRHNDHTLWHSEIVNKF